MGVNVTPKRTQHARGGDPGSNQLNKFLCRPIKVCVQDRMMMGVWRLLVLMGMAMPANGGESSCAVGAGPGPASEDSRQQQPACHSVWAGAPSTAHLAGASALVYISGASTEPAPIHQERHIPRLHQPISSDQASPCFTNGWCQLERCDRQAATNMFGPQERPLCKRTGFGHRRQAN